MYYVGDVLSTFRAYCLFLLAHSCFQTVTVLFDTLFCESASFIARQFYLRVFGEEFCGIICLNVYDSCAH